MNRPTPTLTSVKGSTRQRKIVQEPQPTTEIELPNPTPYLIEPHPAGTMAYLESDMHKIVNDDIFIAHRKEHQELIRKKIKIRTRKEGIVQTFASFYGCPPGSSHYNHFEELQDVIDSDEWGKLSGQETYALFVTLSPEPDTCTALELHDKFMDMFGNKPKKGVAIAIWCIENFTANMERPHLHALLLLDKSTPSGQRARVKAMLIRNLKMFKTKSDAYLQIKAVSERNYVKKLAYIKGEKTDEKKFNLVKQDIEWRKQQGFEQVYYFPPEAGPQTYLD